MASGRTMAIGEGRARRYFSAGSPLASANDRANTFPKFILLSADSQDIIAYFDQPLMARWPVGYQREFLESYLPNQSFYLSKPLHGTLSENLLSNPFDEGRLRQHGVEIGRSVYRPLAVSAQIEGLPDLMLKKANAIEDVFEQSYFIMVDLPYLRPFADDNKRSFGLEANLPLIRANFCPLTFLIVPENAYGLSMLGI